MQNRFRRILKLTNSGFAFLERSEPRFEPLSTVPFQRDPDFVRRDGLLNQIHQRASIPGARIALVGLGGVGFGHTRS